MAAPLQQKLRILMRNVLLVLLIANSVDAAACQVAPGVGAVPARTYEYVASAQKRAGLEKGLLLLKVGDSAVRAIDILGKPDDDLSVSRPRLIGSFEFRARVLSYDLKLVKIGGGNIYDERIDLYFDVHDKLVKIVRAPRSTPQGRKASTASPARTGQ